MTDTSAGLRLRWRPDGPRKFTLLAHDGGITLCDAWRGAVLTIRYPEELAQIRSLLTGIEIKEPAAPTADDSTAHIPS